jgi:hypothetical protein
MEKYYQKIEINLCDLDFFWIVRNKDAAITEATKRAKKLINEIYQDHSDLVKIISIENFKLDEVCKNLENMDSFEALRYLRNDYDPFKIYNFLFTLDVSLVQKMENKIKDKIKDVKWHDELDGWIITLTDNREIQIQYKKVENKLDGNYYKFLPCIDKENEYGLNISEEEEKEINEYIFTNKKILNAK